MTEKARKAQRITENLKREDTIGDITEFVEAKATNTRQPPSVWELPFERRQAQYFSWNGKRSRTQPGKDSQPLGRSEAHRALTLNKHQVCFS